MKRFPAVLLLFAVGCKPDPRYRMAGIDDARDVRAFIRDLQFAVEANDTEALAGMIRYPFTIWNHGEAVRVYADREALLPHLHALFTRRVRQAILDAEWASLFVRDQGVMIGDGEVWFDRHEGETGIRIKAVNAVDASPSPCPTPRTRP